ncbi:Kv channel-interacting protein 2-like [Penaeus monodon]|uniref:Kv channel-interacting protein 2-like n=1 Tax=Penaeus monodon TaxID=6687 RepID=UPI0018A7B6E0|nr:Kv channel-interacting protein 2-like [Penaeus monodon]
MCGGQRLKCYDNNVLRSRPAEDDMDDFSLHVQRYRPEELDKLAKTTKFSRKEIQLIYRGFKQECPTGLIDEEGFKGIFSQFFPLGDATHYAHYVFNTFKRNNQGQISFECLPWHPWVTGYLSVPGKSWGISEHRGPRGTEFGPPGCGTTLWFVPKPAP